MSKRTLMARASEKGDEVKAGLTFRFWTETALSALSCLMFILTLAWPQWIEATFGVNPDHGGGGTEWGIAVGLAVLTVAFGALARSTSKRLLSP